MKARERCCTCLQDLAQQAVQLSGANGALTERSFDLIGRLFSAEKVPTDIANAVLQFISRATGTADIFAGKKDAEFKEARDAAALYRSAFTGDLEGLVRYSCFGNSQDYFGGRYDVADFRFNGDVAAIEKMLTGPAREVLFLGDNAGDFFFDLPLVRFLENAGKRVQYAVKGSPAQNDVTMPDVERWKLRTLFPNIISTGAGEVGLARERMSDAIRDLWGSDALIIAKGMANYETISEFDRERPVIYLLKVKCGTVAEALGRNVGEYTCFIGGVHGS